MNVTRTFLETNCVTNPGGHLQLEGRSREIQSPLQSHLADTESIQGFHTCERGEEELELKYYMPNNGQTTGRQRADNKLAFEKILLFAQIPFAIIQT